MSMIWTISGAGRSVGKTTVARSIIAALSGSVYCKCGHNASRAAKPENFFPDIEKLIAFIDNAADQYSHIVVESNAFVYSNRSDITIYIDGVEGKTDFRPDASRLKAAADIVVTGDSSPACWKEFLLARLAGAKAVDDICLSLFKQQQWIFTTDPKICSKVWFEAGGDFVFGFGLARLLENIDRQGTLQAAAESSKMSYRHAWDMIKSAEKHLGSSLIDRHAGGKGGGGSSLSAKGTNMLASFRLINKEVAEFADKRFRQLCHGEKTNA
ncbi:MAG: LysR family transcriptional regulator [Planctomycetes bacterium]|nr:LysR family transcriptional regulator [Planctomycetota bacterium]